MDATGVADLKDAQRSRLSAIRGVCFDIDDTFSSEGKILPEAFAALWKLSRAGYWCIPITGRPAGWCDHIVRFWPVDAVIGENGAFSFYQKIEGGHTVRRRVDTPSLPVLNLKERHAKMVALRAAIVARFPHAIWASDQEYREYDLAVDICEDVAPWSAEAVRDLLQLCDGLGAHAKVSSIHVNIWFGDHDKKKGFDHLLAANVLSDLNATGKLPLPRARNEWIFAGDSPNDEPLFGHFENSVGVANLRKYLPDLRQHPTWITSRPGGLGFVELVEQLLQARAHG